jgi:hypothetical protein
MLKNLLAGASLIGLVLAMPAIAQQNTNSSGDVLDVKRGQGSAVTGSSELSKGLPPQNGASRPSDAAMIGKDDPQHQQPPSTGDVLNLQRGQGSAVTGASEVGKVSPSAGGIPSSDTNASSPSSGATPGQTLNVHREQGTAATGSSELKK